MTETPMTKTLRPDDVNQLQDAVQAAFGARKPLEIIAHGSKRGLGSPVRATATLDMSAFSGISLYEPEELVMSAAAATPLAEINATLAAQSQMLAFEPWDPAPLFGLAPGRGTIGGVMMAGLAGPRRIAAGSARDHLLGFKAVNGMGELFKSGGRVVKNVTGFDLSKLMAGSFGTLGVATELTFKVLPRPPKARTVVVFGQELEDAGKIMRAALGSAHEVSASAHLPAPSALLSEVGRIKTGEAATLIRVEGPGPSVEHRARALKDQFSAFGAVDELHTENSVRLWREIRDQLVLPASEGRQVWRLSVAPSDGPRVASLLLAQLGGDVTLDWGGGLVWFSVASADDANKGIVRSIVTGVGGHAMVVRADDAVRERAGVFQPSDETIRQLSGRIKQAFDPENILNPGRLGAGIVR